LYKGSSIKLQIFFVECILIYNMQGKDVQNIMIIIRWLKCILIGRKMLLGVGNTVEEGRGTREKKGGKVERFIAIRTSPGPDRNKKLREKE
jgi:hypothetical protein